MSATMIDRAKVEAMFVVFSTVFDMKLTTSPTIYKEIATVIPGVSERVEFKWLGSLPTLQRWVGDRTMQRLRGESHVLTTEWWANGIEVDVDDLNNGAKLGMIALRIRDIASACARRMDDQVAQYYMQGFAANLGVTYDGQFCFDTDHTADGSGRGVPQSNVITGGFTSANFNLAVTRMLQLVDDQGEPIGVPLRKVLAGPLQQLALRQILKAETGPSGASNVDAGFAQPYVAQRITGNQWFGLADEEIKAVIIGVEVEPQFASADRPESFEMFMRRNALYGAHCKFGLCYGMWQSASGSQG